MIVYMFQKYIDPEGYETNQKIKFGVLLFCIVLYTLWKSVVEVQFFFVAQTTTATILGNERIQYSDGTDTRREKLRVPDSAGDSVTIDYLPGVGLARLHGTRNLTPIIVLLVAVVVSLMLLAPVIREARDFANGTPSRRPRR